MIRRKHFVKKVRTPLRRLAIAFLLVSVLLVGIMTAAAATADRLYISRLIAWREADFRDFKRFPSRAVPAGSKEFSFKHAYLRTRPST